MSSPRISLSWLPLSVVLLIAGAPVIRAGDAPAVPDGFKKVSLQNGGSILVQKERDPFQNLHLAKTGKYDPQDLFSTSNPMAHKQFLSGSSSEFRDDSALKGVDQTSFLTKADSSLTRPFRSSPNLNTTFSTPTVAGFNGKAFGADKKFAATSPAIKDHPASLYTGSVSSDAGRKADIGHGSVNTFASPLAARTYEGDERQIIRRDLSEMNEGLMQLKDLPDRPLTVDEVRALINHGIKPNTDELPAEEPSKPLNDPNYRPEPTPQAPPESTDDDRDAPVPPPGTMAQPPPPENADSLPQH